MTLDKIIVTVLGILGMVFTYWFFLTKKQKVKEVLSSVDIVVEGGYSPDTISITKGKPTKISFTRKDPSSCLEEVVLSDFKVKEYLPLNKKVTIQINPNRVGEFNFSCGMNMHHGKIIVR